MRKWKLSNIQHFHKTVTTISRVVFATSKVVNLPVHVPVETVMQGNEFKLQKLWCPPPSLHVEVLQAREVGLVPWQGEVRHF